MIKEKGMYIYKLLKPILGPIYKFYYNPKIIGAENIPQTGPILVVGNHIHLMDQCNVIIATKRCLHYMAKKEYFDSAKTRWFFKSVGCISVNRKIHDDNAKSKAMEVLNNDLALGLFPEGTRNSLKEDYIKKLHSKYFTDVDYKDFYKKIKNNRTSQVDYLVKLLEDNIITISEFKLNIFKTDEYLKYLVSTKKIKKQDYYDNILLPFKFGTVSMAQKSNALIVPYAISGSYKFRSKDLTINIGKPIKVDKNANLEKVNTKLYNTVKKLLEENLSEK